MISLRGLCNSILQRPHAGQTFIWPYRFSAERQASSASSVSSITLNNLCDNPGARKQRTRWGRGVGSGRGKTCGRGHKGQKSRSGNRHPRLGFEGGQFPFYRRVPKRGFKNVNHIELEPLNLGKLQQFIDRGKLPTDQVINMRTLRDSGVVGKIHDGVKILGDGATKFHTPVNLEVTAASKSAVARLKETQSILTLVKLNGGQLRKLLKKTPSTLREAHPFLSVTSQ
jgi:large subunit ribosomal protein L15